MKIKNRVALASILGWVAVETPLCWVIWNRVIARVFELPHLAFWEVLVILVFVGCLFPSTHSMYLGHIAEKMEAK